MQVLPVISPVLFHSGGLLGVGERDGPANHRAVVYRLGSVLSRSRFCRRGVSFLRLCLPGGAGEAMAVALQRDKGSRSRPRPFGGLLRRQGWIRGKGDLPNPLCWSWRGRLMAAPFVKGTVAVVGGAASWRMGRARGPGGRSRRRALSQDRWSSGCIPGRCSSNGAFIPASLSGVLCGSCQSFAAMELFLIHGGHDVFLDGGRFVGAG